MTRVYRAVAMISIMMALAVPGMAQDEAQTPRHKTFAHPHSLRDEAAGQITAQLKQFLANASDPAMNSRFWADDLIYVSFSGAVRGKPEILKSVRAAVERISAGKEENREDFTAEEITVRSYGSIAVLNFTLVSHELQLPDVGSRDTVRKGVERTRHYRVSGVFRQNEEGWQAVNWQATGAPEPAK